MGLFAEFKKLFIVHLLIGYIFIVSGLIVNFLMLCTCIIWPFNKTLYRKIICILAYWHWCQLTFLGQWWSGSNCVVVTDPKDVKHYGKEHALIILNHKYDIDWLMGWILCERLGVLGGSKVYGKESLKYVPLIGWAWIFCESIFLKRNWEQDRRIIMKDLGNLANYPVNFWLLMFCEGTRFTEEKKRLSNEVARQKGLPELKHHLLPRTRGFVLTMNGLKGSQMRHIYDCTIGVRRDLGAEPTLLNIIYGRACHSELYVRRIPCDEVPTETEEDCAAYLHKLYKEKDDLYEGFKQRGHFEGHRVNFPRRGWDLLIWCIWAVLLLVPLFYYLWNLFTLGTLYQQLAVVLIIVVASVIVRAMIAVTEIEKGSKYGQQNGDQKKD